MQQAKSWFKSKGWKISTMQKEVCNHVLAGQNGLLNAPTGSGKTLALAVPMLIELARKNCKAKGVRLIWITPLKALSNDIRNALQDAAESLLPGSNVMVRNGDTSIKDRQKFSRKASEILVITPESLHLLLSQKKADELFTNLQYIVVDEWHELMGSKRGVQVELSLAFLKNQLPNLKCWGISATIGNLDKAADVLLKNFEAPVLVKDSSSKKIEIKTLLPDIIEKYPRSGHMGLPLAEKLAGVFKQSETCLIFTNTRAQCELWYMKILEVFPDLAGRIAIHHGSLDREIRNWVEWALHNKILKVVVCTSSLDLGVDFRPVDAVVQIGSPKGVSRFVQRAGRSGHAPGLPAKIWFLPTHVLELIESVALQESVAQQISESRESPVMCFDVLAQFMVTLACGKGFDPHELFDIISQTHAFAFLNHDEFMQVLHFVESGGSALKEYEEYRKITQKEVRKYVVVNKRVAFKHRLQIGTIFSISGLQILNRKGKRLGTVEEFFISKLKVGDCFNFSGKTLMITKIEAHAVRVQDAPAGSKALTPAWMGGRLSFSSEVTEQLLKVLQNLDVLIPKYPELQLLTPMLDKQVELSQIPGRGKLVAEITQSKEGTHLFVFPFEGRRVNEAVAMLLAYRIGKKSPATFSVSCNDYGFELFTDIDFEISKELLLPCLSAQNLREDLLATHNYSELLKKRFTEICTVAGILHKDHPNAPVKQRHLQNSAALLFKVLQDYEPNHILLRQAADEVSLHFMEELRIRQLLLKIQNEGLELIHCKNFSPFSFPLMAEGLREKLSTEKLEARLERILKKMGE